MPLTPTPGTDALAAGMPLVPGTGLASDLDEYINQTRDFIAQRTSTVTPIAKGGTGATTAAAARAALGVPTTAEVATKVTNSTSASNAVALGWTGGRLRMLIDGSNQGDIANTGDIEGRFPKTGGTISGSTVVDGGLGVTGNFEVAQRLLARGTIEASGTLSLASATAVTSGYVALYRNGDGRVGISPSARRFKKDIRPHTYTLEQLAGIRVVDYRLRADVYGSADAPVDVGVIAEELIEAGLSEFVVFDEDGAPLSVYYERLALVAIGALQELARETDLLAQRIDALENRA